MADLHGPASKFLRRIAKIEEKVALVDAEKEAQLAEPVKAFLNAAASELGKPAKGLEFWDETRINVEKQNGRNNKTTVKPDIGVHEKGDTLAIGHIELKAMRKGANWRSFSGHDAKQAKKYMSLGGLNLIYSDGWEWSLLQDKKWKKEPFMLADASDLELREFFGRFFEWQPTVPHKRRELAAHIAGHCRLIRDSAVESLKNKNSSINSLKKAWQEYLFPHTNDAQFADYYAQTLTYALFLAHLRGTKKLTTGTAADYLRGSDILASALRVLATDGARKEIGWGLRVLERSLLAIDKSELLKQTEEEQLWLYFYEDFLAAYDPNLRRDFGAYYTPLEVVKFQTRLVADILEKEFGKPLAYADEGVNFIDPAAGTGTYLVAALEEAIGRIRKNQGAGAVAGKAAKLQENMHGFEIMIGPYAVAVLRVAETLESVGAELGGEKRLKIHLADTLASPMARSKPLGLFDEAARTLREETKHATEIKKGVPIMVCIGNPPYDRHDAKKGEKNWIRYGDHEAEGKKQKKHEMTSLLEDFARFVRRRGDGKHLKNIYNSYVYFWRWALWKVCEPAHRAYRQEGEALERKDGGIVSFITASSYLDGPAFTGMRSHMRQLFDEIYIVDLGGDSISMRKSKNVFNIKTPVAIAICVRKPGGSESPRKANVRYYDKTAGTRAEKLVWLDNVGNKDDVTWQKCPPNKTLIFLPKPEGKYFDNPKLASLLPFQHSGVQFKKTWPIGENEDVLKKRWQKFEKLSRDEKQKYLPEEKVALDKYSPEPKISRYGFCSFDRQYAFLDNRICARPRAILGEKHSVKQIYLTSPLTNRLGGGPRLPYPLTYQR